MMQNEDLLRIDALPRASSLGDLRYRQFGGWEAYPPKQVSLRPPVVANPENLPLKPTAPCFFDPATLFPSAMTAHPVYLSKLTNAICHPGGIIAVDDRIFVESFRAGLGDRTGLDVVRTSAVAPRVIEEPAIFLDGEHFAAFGHFLGEIATRLWFVRLIALDGFKILIGRDCPGFIKVMLEGVGIGPEALVRVDQPILCRELLTPSQGYRVRQSISAAAFDAWDLLRYHLEDDAPSPSRVYMTRHFVNSRKLLNELDVHEVFERRSFAVVRPEILTIPQQIGLFAKADMIAGCAGSNMFSLGFARRHARGFILSPDCYLVHNENLIASRLRDPLTYFIGRAKQRGHVFSDWTVDVAALERALDAWLEGAEGEAAPSAP